MSARPPVCPACDRIHHAGLTRAVGIFGDPGEVAYQAVGVSAPLRATRADAIIDWCAAMTRRRDEEPLSVAPTAHAAESSEIQHRLAALPTT